MPEVFREEEAPYIPYPSLTNQIFDSDQRLIPFLGAGASLTFPPAAAAQHPPESTPDARELCAQLGLQSEAAVQIMAVAVRAAQAAELHTAAPQSGSAARTTVPSAGELAALLAALSRYETFDSAADRVQQLLHLTGVTAQQRQDLLHALRTVAETTGIAPTAPPLSSVAGYYEYSQQREQLWQTLYKIFEPQRTTTPTHRLTAKAAKYYLDTEPLKNYLILSTNYDQLIETALDALSVPYCVLAVAKNDWRVDVRFSPAAQSYLGLNDRRYREMLDDVKARYPSAFVLTNRKPLVVLFKIHGCLFTPEPGRDSIVISDEDYIDYIYRMAFNEGVIPMEVVNLMIRKSFLFLGYSFSDWNIRGIHRRVLEKRAERGVNDYAVVNCFNPFERRFFDQYKIHVLQTELDTFCRKLAPDV